MNEMISACLAAFEHLDYLLGLMQQLGILPPLGEKG
jgi:hypothetical protein